MRIVAACDPWRAAALGVAWLFARCHPWRAGAVPRRLMAGVKAPASGAIAIAIAPLVSTDLLILDSSLHFLGLQRELVAANSCNLEPLTFSCKD